MTTKTKVHVGVATNQLLKKLEKGFNGIDIPLQPETPEEWDHQYAICDGFYFDHLFDCDNPYVKFDSDQLIIDFKNMLKEHFGVEKIYGDDAKKVSPAVGDLVVRLFPVSQELEVYYQTYPHGEALVWWLDQAACEQLNKNTLPDYILEQLACFRLGSGQRRLWIPDLFHNKLIEEIVQSVDTSKWEAIPKGDGIVFHMNDRFIVKKLPGVVTDLNLDIIN